MTTTTEETAKTNKIIKDALITIRVKSTQKEALKNLAKTNGTTLSKEIEKLIANAVG
jgi:predicted DNA binding CopG/RHH family protein